MTRAYVGLGSNLGDRMAHLRAGLRALGALPGTRVVACSTVVESEPVGGPLQGPYLNAAVALDTQLEAAELLSGMLAIEKAEGRVRSGSRDEPRTLDLDLLLYGERVQDEPGLTLPHPRLAERAFVLTPLVEIVPAGLRHPATGETVASLEERRRDPQAVRPWPERLRAREPGGKKECG